MPLPATQRLSEAIADALNADQLARSERLGRLAIRAAACIDGAEGPRRAVAYTLHWFFRRAERYCAERRILPDEARRFRATVEGPVTRAAKFMENDGTANEAVSIIVALSEAEAAS